MNQREQGPRSKLARYAFGYSDEKPGLLWWLLNGAMVAYVIHGFVTLR